MAALAGETEAPGERHSGGVGHGGRESGRRGVPQRSRTLGTWKLLTMLQHELMGPHPRTAGSVR